MTMLPLKVHVQVGEDHLVKLPDEVPVGPGGDHRVRRRFDGGGRHSR
jgi:hypothetical protein